MEPGMACISCHNRGGGEAPRFAIAGTVYPTAHEPDLCNGANGSNGAQVVITGSDGKSITLTANGVGNFSSNAAVAMPYQAKITYMGRERLMIAAQTSGDCNSCHTQTGATMAPGRLLLP
jgi:cytochrome c553